MDCKRKETLFSKLYQEYFGDVPFLSIRELMLHNKKQSFQSLSVKKIMQEYAILEETSSSKSVYFSEKWSKPVLVLEYVFSSWDVALQDEMMNIIVSRGIPCVVLDYTLAERTIEWIFAYLKYIKAFFLCPSYSSFYQFLENGGLYALLAKHRMQPRYSHRFPLTQEEYMIL